MHIEASKDMVSRQYVLRPFEGVHFTYRGTRVPELRIGFPGNEKEIVRDGTIEGYSLLGTDYVGVLHIDSAALQMGDDDSTHADARYLLQNVGMQVMEADNQWGTMSNAMFTLDIGIMQLRSKVGLLTLLLCPSEEDSFVLYGSYGVFSSYPSGEDNLERN
jgi:hypothetical protein